MSFSEVLQRIKSVNLARSNRYSVKFLASPVGRDPYVEYFAESVSFPGQNVRSTPDLLRYGPQREHAQAFTYGPINMTFMCTTGQPEKKFFENWQDFIIAKNSWEAKFYKDYICDIELNSLDMNSNETYKVTIYEAFPKTINAQEFSYSSADSYQTVSVEFSYRWWESEINAPSGSVSSPRRARAQLPKNNQSTVQTAEQAIASNIRPPIVDEVFAITKPQPSSDSTSIPTSGQPVPLQVDSRWKNPNTIE